MTAFISRRRHLVELARLRASYVGQIERMQQVADRVERRRASTWLEAVSEAYRLDAEHPTSGKAHTAPSQRGLNPAQRLVVQHELETVARDILKEV